MFDQPSVSSGDTPPHQDNTFQCWDPPYCLAATVAIDESTPDNGVLWCQTGTHKLGLLPHKFSGTVGFSRKLIEPVDEEKHPWVELCMKPGDMAIHHTLSVHAANVNRSGLPRRQAGIGYISSQARRDQTAWAQYQKDLDLLHTQRNLA